MQVTLRKSVYVDDNAAEKVAEELLISFPSLFTGQRDQVDKLAAKSVAVAAYQEHQRQQADRGSYRR
jgi:hypothetical protein